MKKNPTRKSNLKRKRKHGFLKRSSSNSGKAMISRRRKKGKKVLTA